MQQLFTLLDALMRNRKLLQSIFSTGIRAFGRREYTRFFEKYIEDIQVFGENMSFISLSEVKIFYIS